MEVALGCRGIDGCPADEVADSLQVVRKGWVGKRGVREDRKSLFERPAPWDRR